MDIFPSIALGTEYTPRNHKRNESPFSLSGCLFGSINTANISVWHFAEGGLAE